MAAGARAVCSAPNDLSSRKLHLPPTSAPLQHKEDEAAKAARRQAYVEEETKAQAAAEPAKRAAAAAAAADDALKAKLLEIAAVDASVLKEVLAAAQKAAGGATAAYLAKKEPYVPVEGEVLDDLAVDDEDEAAEPTLQLRYVATTDGHEWMLKRSMVEGQGVTFPCWVLPEVDEEEEEEEELEEGEEAPVRPPPELPTITVDSVLHDGPVKFLAIPRLGGYVAVPVRYKSLLHAEALPEVPEPAEEEAEEEVDGEEGEEEEGKDVEEGEGKQAQEEAPVPAGNAVDVDLALCVDSVGQNRAFTAEEVAALQGWGKALQGALERTELATYEAEWRKLEAMRLANATLLEGWEETLLPLQDAAEEARASAAAAAEEGEEEAGVKEELTALLEARVPLHTTVAALALPGLEQQWATTVARHIPLAGEALKVLCAAAHLLGASKADIGDATSRSPTEPHWPTLTEFLGKEALKRVAKFDAEAVWPAEAAAVAEAAAAAAAAAAEGKDGDDEGDGEGKDAESSPSAATGAAAGGAKEAAAQAASHADSRPDVEAAKEAVDGIEREGLLKGTYNSALLFGVLLDWVQQSLAVNEAAAAWRARLKADAEEAAREAAEAAARLAEEEAEAEREESED